MSYFLIKGGRCLSGRTEIHGAKNSVLPILAAALLARGESTIENCPQLSDVSFAINILESLGCSVSRSGRAVTVDGGGMTGYSVPVELMREMRSSVIFLGAILARCGRAELSTPGGCELGPRPIDLHISALRRLGVRIEEENGHLSCFADDMCGTDIELPFPSVGATENIMLAASACHGTTRIINAAREPEIVDLQLFLQGCGIKISGAGGNVIEIEGCEAVKPNGSHRVMPDRIETATYMAACCAAGGDIELCGADIAHLLPVADVFRAAGAEIEVKEGFMRVKARGLRGGARISTQPYPGFPTDAQPPVMAAMALASGTTVFRETIFQNRYRHVPELLAMGADICVNGDTAVVTGVKALHGADVTAPDLRGGAALAAAAAAADGYSVIRGLEHIDRGYERLERSLRELGADAERKE